MAKEENEFTKKLNTIMRTAREQGGVIREEQVRTAFASIHLDEDQYKIVFDYLKKHNIGIGEPAEECFLTDEEKNYLDKYLKEVEALGDVSDGEKEAITISAMAGDKNAQQRLAEIYLSSVADIARLYVGQGVSIEDLIGEGNVAVTFAAEMAGSMDKPSEVPGMLARSAMDAMEDLINADDDNERTAQKIAKRTNQVMEKAEELSEDLRRKVTPQELSDETGMSVDRIMQAVQLSGYKIDCIEVDNEDSTV